MLKRKQLLILSELRQNSRQPISDIAKKLNLPASTVHENYKKTRNCIKQNTSLINFAKLGYSLRMNFIFTIKSSKIKFLKDNRHVNSIYRINNKRTFLTECFFKNLCQAYEFREALQSKGASRMSMRYVTEEIKREEFFPE